MAVRPVSVVLMAYGTPQRPERDRGVLHRHPPRSTADAGGARRPHRPLRRDRRRLAARRAHRRATRRAPALARRARTRAGSTSSLGMKHADPKVEAVAARGGRRRRRGDRRAGARTALLVVLDRRLPRPVPRAAPATRVPVIGIESWATEPAFVEFLADDLAERRAAMRDADRPRRSDGAVHRPFAARSASSTPATRIPTSSRSTAVAVADRLGLDEGADWSIAWQSAGRTPEPWIGPDILQVIDELGAAGDVGGVIVCACGFVADHLEVLYDLDIEAAAPGRRGRSRLRSHRQRQRRSRR